MNSKPVRILYFASARSAVNLSSEAIELPSTPYPLSSLADLLVSRHADTALATVLEISAWSVDQTMVSTEELHNYALHGGEEVAVIPPVSGG